MSVLELLPFFVATPVFLLSFWMSVQVFLFLLGIGFPDRALTEGVLRVYSESLDRPDRLPERLRGLRGLARIPFCWRLGRAAARLEEGEEDPLTVLRATRCLPRGMTAGLASARAIDDRAQRSMIAAECRRSSLGILSRFLALYLPYLLLMGHLVPFVLIDLAPKFQQLFKELGIEPNRSLRLLIDLADLAAHPLVQLGALASYVAIAFAVWAWRQRVGTTRRAMVLLEMVRAGWAEGRIARTLAGLWPRFAGRLRAAGEAGDFAALCRAAGVAANHPDDLPLLLDRRRRRQRLLAEVAGIAAGILLPVILGFPVILMALGFFGSLVTIMEAVPL